MKSIILIKELTFFYQIPYFGTVVKPVKILNFSHKLYK